MGSLLDRFAGSVDLIYTDPPFATGADFGFVTEIGEDSIETAKEQSLLEEKAYRDTWGAGLATYAEMVYSRFTLMDELLAPHGSIYVHLDYHVAYHVKLILDEVFGPDCFRNGIIWQKTRVSKQQSRFFGRNHDIILFYSKRDDAAFTPQFTDYEESYKDSHYNLIEEGTGRRHGLWDFTQKGAGPPRRFGDRVLPPPAGKHWIWSQERIDQGMADGRIAFTSKGMPRLKRYLDEAKGRYLGDIWTDIFDVNSMADERTGYATQKPAALAERVIASSSREGDLVADFFCGSGTALVAAEQSGRRWIGCDLSRWALHVTRKRLLSLEDCGPFEILNLGKYERKYWQTVTFAAREDQDRQLAIYQYLAFILRLYGAEPLAGMQHIHGKKDKALIHIGAVDAPVTIDEISNCLDEAAAIGQSEVHVLAWEWEMGLANPMVQEAKQRGMKLLLLNIPREVMEEQAVEKGDVRFFEVAHLGVDISAAKAREVRVELTEFAFPYADLILEEVRDKIKRWSDYIDYWAVDWDFQNDTFMNGWVTYRTRKDRTLALQSDPHTHDDPGTYQIMVKVVDIFGNDTSQVFEVTVG